MWSSSTLASPTTARRTRWATTWSWTSPGSEQRSPPASPPSEARTTPRRWAPSSAYNKCQIAILRGFKWRDSFWVLELSWWRNLSFVSISRLGRHAQPPCTTCKSLRLNLLYNCDSQVDCALHLHLLLRLAQFVLIVLGRIVLRHVLVCLCACVPNLAKSTRLASWKALKKPSSGPMHEHWAPKELSLGFNFEFCKCKWRALNKPFMI